MRKQNYKIHFIMNDKENKPYMLWTSKGGLVQTIDEMLAKGYTITGIERS